MPYILSKKINQYFHAVTTALKVRDDFESSKKSDANKSTYRSITPEDNTHIWKNSEFKVFLSHLAKDKEQTSILKKQLEVFGVSCFVAHLSIRPTKEWQEEIEKALFSMDVLIALLTKDFSKSNWTDQEIGIALGREVPVIPLKIEKNPYGFIGKIQAISYSWDDSPTKIIKHLIKYDKMIDAYLGAVYNCSSFENGLKLAGILPYIVKLSEPQVERLISAFNQNSQVSGCWGFSGASKYGKGLIHHLQRITGKSYELSPSEKIVPLHSP